MSGDNFTLSEEKSDLERVEYHFQLFDNAIIVLDGVTRYTRESKRQKKWIPRLEYQRLSSRRGEEPELPVGIHDKAIAHVRDRIQISTWDEYRTARGFP